MSATVVAATALLPARYGSAADPVPTLVGRAVLPADTFAAGPNSGAQITPARNNGRISPFAGQPVQGISAIIEAGGGSYWALADNGYGSKGNSADFLLRAYNVKPNFAPAGDGKIQVIGYMQFSDPFNRVPWPIVNERSAGRELTGADFDIESIRKDNNGDFWVGEEFGPFILHFDSMGRLMDAPFTLSGVRSPDSPRPGSTTLGSSRGFEGMSLQPNGRTLIATLEGALTADSNQNRRYFYEFDTASKSYTGRSWQYRMEAPANSFGDVTALDANRLLVIERDQNEGAAAMFKRIYVVDLRKAGPDGFLTKKLVVDLMNIADPKRVSGTAQPGEMGIGATFTMPFVTIEGVLVYDAHTLLVTNDNNYPFSNGRKPGSPDNNEFVLIDIPNLMAD